MSFFHTVVDKVAGSAMAASPGLAAFTVETLDIANTSVHKMKQNVEKKVSSEITATVSDDALSSIFKVKTTLSEMYPRSKHYLDWIWMDAHRNLSKEYLQTVKGYNHTEQFLEDAAVHALEKSVQKFQEGIFHIPRLSLEKADELLVVADLDLALNKQKVRAVCKKAYASAQEWVWAQYNDVVEQVIDGVKRDSLLFATTPPNDAGDTVSEGADARQNNTIDNIHQEIHVYIEGVEVPFIAISISTAMGGLPQAQIEVPPQSGLMDIARYYQPKVHIFYADKNYGGNRLLFSGHIVAPNYSKSRQGQGRAVISFSCMHKNALMDGLTLEYGGIATGVNPSLRNSNPDQAAIKVGIFNSTNSIIEALHGLRGIQSDSKDLIDPSNTAIATADPALLSPKFAEFNRRYEGMPAIVMNLWNQLKKLSYGNPAQNTIMTKMYIPLIEDGLKFFNRLSGHFVLETQIQNSTQAYCPGKASPDATKDNILIAPRFRLNNLSAINATLMVSNLGNTMNYSGEFTTFMQLLGQFLYAVDYEIVTLSSPSEVPKDPTVLIDPDSFSSWATTPKMAIETIIKPQLPFYYAPLCNLILPRMFHTVSVSQEEASLPTRITVFHDAIIGQQGMIASSYRAPPSIREAVAIGIGAVNSTSTSATQTPIDINLVNTTNGSYNVPGKYEQGRGVKHRKLAMPQWLAHLVKGKVEESADKNKEVWPAEGTPDYDKLMDLSAAWTYRYGYKINPENGAAVRDTSKDAMNPYSPKSKIDPSQRILFASADYEYTKAMANSRSGAVEALFNPYVVVGYPMDIVDSSPNHPSFHALCTSVTHNITSRSIGTSIGFAAASTFTEMTNYYMPPLHPWMSTALGLINPTFTKGADYSEIGEVSACASTLINNPEAKAVADEFYRQVFGVGAVAVDEIFDFQTGLPIPIRRQSGILAIGSASNIPQDNGGEGNPYLTSVGNLLTVSRPIEGRKAVEARFGVKFIDLTPALYNGSQVQYLAPVLTDLEQRLLEPGASLFLDYTDTDEFVK